MSTWNYEVVGTKEAVAEAVKHIPENNANVPEVIQTFLNSLMEAYLWTVAHAYPNSANGVIIKTSGNKFNFFDAGSFTIEVRTVPLVQ